jgi:hypothetical protein
MSSKYDDLEKLADLKNKGIITEEEFNLKKSQILNLDSNKQNINGDNEPTQEGTIKSNQPEKNISTANNGYTKQQSFHKNSGIWFKIIGTIISIIILGALIITNPTKADFQNYISNRIQKSSGNAEDSSNKFLSALATLAVNQITERDNYFVCSLYTVNTTFFKIISDKVPDNPKFLGIFGQFIPLNVAFKDKDENVGQQAESVSVPVPAKEVPSSALASVNATTDEYLFELLAKPEYYNAWNTLFSGESNVDPWLAEYAKTKDGPATPAETITLGSISYKYTTVCKAHDCGNNKFYVLFAPNGTKAWGLLQRNDVDEIFFGNPDDEKKTFLHTEATKDPLSIIPTNPLVCETNLCGAIRGGIAGFTHVCCPQGLPYLNHCDCKCYATRDFNCHSYSPCKQYP